MANSVKKAGWQSQFQMLSGTGMRGDNMAKIIVIYHSQQFGNTKVLAEALAEGAREAGAEVGLINTNERRVTLDEFLAADAVALGTPDYFSYLAGTIKTFITEARGRSCRTCIVRG
jgi:multimeric flavodoxin WrbA